MGVKVYSIDSAAVRALRGASAKPRRARLGVLLRDRWQLVAKLRGQAARIQALEAQLAEAVGLLADLEHQCVTLGVFERGILTPGTRHRIQAVVHKEHR